MRPCECGGFGTGSSRSSYDTRSWRPRHAAVAVGAEERSDEPLIVAIPPDILHPVGSGRLPGHTNNAAALSVGGLSAVSGAHARAVERRVWRRENVAVSAFVLDLVLMRKRSGVTIRVVVGGVG
jgi:hypothetical protein